MRQIRLITVFSAVVILFLAGWAPAQQGGSSEGHHHMSWTAPDKEKARKNPVAADKASIAEGKKLYQTHCAACHGETGRGDGPAGAALKPRPTDLTHSAHHEDGELAWKISTGRPPMPAWKGTLTETQIWQVVNYIKQAFGMAQGGHHGQGGHR